MNLASNGDSLCNYRSWQALTVGQAGRVETQARIAVTKPRGYLGDQFSQGMSAIFVLLLAIG